MTSSASQPYSVDWRYIKKVWREITASEYLKEKIDAIPEVVDNVHDRSTDKALSANQWRLLQDQIDELKTPWKFLANWNSATWLSEISLSTNPYVYSNWDYFVVTNVSNTTNYKPNWIMYTDWVASDVEETDAVSIDDRYMFNWNDWVLIPTSQKQISVDQALSSTSTNPVENRVIKAKLDSMDADIEDKANASSGATWEQPAWNPGDIYVDEDEDKIYIKWVDSWKDISEWWWGGWETYTAWEWIEITEDNVINCTVEWDVYTEWEWIEITEENEIKLRGEKDIEVLSDTKQTISLDQYKVNNYEAIQVPYWKYVYREWAYSYKIPVWDMRKLELKTKANWWYISFLRTCNIADWERLDYVSWFKTMLYEWNTTTWLWIPTWAQYVFISWKAWENLVDYWPSYLKSINAETETLSLIERTDSVEDYIADNKWYRWKIISIMWDSISTFRWYMPEADWYNITHRIYYPKDFLNDVNDTRWLKLIKNLWAKLWVNESFSWSKVVNTDSTSEALYKECMASVTRITNMWANWTPDVILFYWWTNDIWWTIPVWTFNSSINYNTTDLTTTAWSTFADWYKDAIMRMQYFYPMAKIIVLLPAYAADGKYTMAKLDSFNDMIKLICDYFWVQYFDLRACWINRQNIDMTMWDARVHPNVLWADIIEKYIRTNLLWTYELTPWENVTYPIWFDLAEWVTVDKSYLRAVSAWSKLEVTLNSLDALSVTVTMWWVDISSSYNPNTNKITINSVTWEIDIVAATSTTTYQYTVNHYQQNLDWSTYPETPTLSESLSAIAWTVVSPMTQSYTWFTSPSAQTVTIDQSWIVVDYYYTRNSYTLSFNTNWWSSAPSETVYYWADIESLLPTVTKTWYYLPEDISQAWDDIPSSFTMPAEDLEISAFWVPDWVVPETTWYSTWIATWSWKISWSWVKELWTWSHAYTNNYFWRDWTKTINTMRFESKLSSWYMEISWADTIWQPRTLPVISKNFTSSDKSWNIVTIKFTKSITCVYPCVFPVTYAAAWWVITYIQPNYAPAWTWWYSYNIFGSNPLCQWCDTNKWYIYMQFWYVDYRSWQNQEPSS